jgi:hypothetical protein
MGRVQYYGGYYSQPFTVMEITEQGQKIQISVEYEKLEQKDESDDEEMYNFK